MDSPCTNTVPKLVSHVPAYDAVRMHADIEADKFIGVYGGANSIYHGIAEAKLGNVDLLKVHKKRGGDEYAPVSVTEYLALPSTQTRWNEIVSFDPWGMDATRPTIAATTATMDLPELKGLIPDGGLVTEEGGIKITKIAIDHVFNMPGLAVRLGVTEELLRDEFYKYSQNDRMMNKDLKAFLPAIPGITVYIFGDLRKLADPTTEVALRCHDECNGSDVFCTDICTCRPYLIYAIDGALKCAQRGGVGLIVYFRKEGRALGEVTKFRVYNARKNQVGGDRPETYFKQTESIAGIRDARFQEMMPDVLLWLGLKRIDWYFSMSLEKYEAIAGMGVSVMQRIDLPDAWVPKGATVEITAKVAAGYHKDTLESIAERLRQPEGIREQCGQIFKLAQAGQASHFTVDMSKVPETVQFVVDTIHKNYPTLKIPHHSRLRHFEAGGVDRVAALVAKWKCDDLEKARRVLDLITVSVLLDAGAGPEWQYTDEAGQTYGRSEGLAIASFDLFCSGVFSSDPAQPHRVNSMALKALQLKSLTTGFQVNAHNKMTGLEGRVELLQRLGLALEEYPTLFGAECQRPGNLLDYMIGQAGASKRVSVRVLWNAVINGLANVWPASIGGVRRGDIWIYAPLRAVKDCASDMVPFHKLSQWLMHSLMEGMANYVTFDDLHLMTGLAEYRNGGLLVDLGVLVPKDPNYAAMTYAVGSELVVEWRALTICLIDIVAEGIRKTLGKTADELPLSRILEGGTWYAGRVAAKARRANGNPPISVRLDGTVF